MSAPGRLTALRVEKAKQSGMYADGGGLYLRITKDGTKNWVYRFMLNGRPRWMGLGPFDLYGLKEAREKALDARRLRHAGIDPIDTRKAQRAQELIKGEKALTFKQCSEAYIKSKRSGWKNAKHAAQWASTLATYVDPIIGSLPVAAIDTTLVMKILEQEVGDTAGTLWTAKPETASRLRGRMEAILDWAKVRGYREGENPARWRGHLDKLLPAKAKVRKVEHHAALPYDQVPSFIASLRALDAIAARALEFAILTAARTGEVIGARWNEIDLMQRLWTVPAARMKAGKEHRVPLSDRAIAILNEVMPQSLANHGQSEDGQAYVFPGARYGHPLSNMAFLMLLRRMKRDDLTAHGFRSSFRDWAAERSYPTEVAEMALAHAISNKVEAAYRRSDLFERRRQMMNDWARFCATPPNDVGRVTSMVNRLKGSA